MTETTTLPTVELAPGCGIGQELRCPRCGYTDLHHGRVTIFDRNEDAEMTVVTTVAGGLAEAHLLPSDTAGNPSFRRDGLAIAFACEGCGDDLELTIAQNGGSSTVAWRFRTGEA
jgi:hypothetical protein